MADEPVQRIPFGLLSFLGTKSSGLGPNKLLRELRPVLDITPNYLAPDISNTIVQTAGVSIAGDEARIQVPAGEAWRMISLSLVCTAFSSTTAVVYATLGIGDLTGFITAINAMPQPYTVVAVTDLVRLGYAFPSPLVLPPGSVMHASLMADLGGGTTANLQCRALYHRMLV